ncbi:MAG: nicotinate (nicotinamide) nucleotide adenylyltransferase [Hellea sp.]|nr:nicotinate (nicotinamide) nucleotide adenylyltransferase [Hellea sp.]
MNYEGLSIGLFGGSFNPAHAGHLHVARTGLRALGLDQVWWMVSPQNPLKPAQPSYESRVATVEALDLPYDMKISHMEMMFGTQYTVDTLRAARQKWPNANFVFLMGADNFLQLPKWRSWKTIMETVPVAVIARPGKNHSAIRSRLGKAAQIYRNYRISERDADVLKYYLPPAWTYLTPPMNALSSTAIRKSRSKR